MSARPRLRSCTVKSSPRTGHPLGLMSTGKKAFVPNSSANQVDSLPLRAGFYSTNSNPSFRLLIPDQCRFATSHNEAIRSVTHLVLAHKLPRSLSVRSWSVFFILKASGGRILENLLSAGAHDAVGSAGLKLRRGAGDGSN